MQTYLACIDDAEDDLNKSRNDSHYGSTMNDQEWMMYCIPSIVNTVDRALNQGNQRFANHQTVEICVTGWWFQAL